MSAWDSYIFDNVETDYYPYDDGDKTESKKDEDLVNEDEVIPF